MVVLIKEKKKINWLLIIPSVFAGCLLFVLLAGIVFYKTSFSIYENKKEGLVIPYPKGWIVMEHPLNLKDAIVVFVSPKDNPMDMLQENITVTTVDQSKNPLDIDGFAAMTIKQNTLVFNDCKVKSSFPTLISGRRAHRTVFYFRGEEMSLVMALYQFMFRDVVGYNVMYYGDIQTYEKRYQFKFDLLAHMIKIFF